MFTNFDKWMINEGMPANWTPSPSTHADPLQSALRKILSQPRQMPFDGNFTDRSVFQTRFGLDDSELNALVANKLIIRGDHGFNIARNAIALTYLAHQEAV